MQDLLRDAHDSIVESFPDAHCLCLLDAGLWQQSLPKSVLQAGAVDLFEGTSDAGKSLLAPRLIAVNPDNTKDNLVLSLLRLEEKKACTHWLWTLEDIATTAQRLRFLNTGQLQDGSYALIRYFDREVWAFLEPALDEEQRRFFINPLISWATFENQTLHHIRGQCTGLALPSQALKWTDKQIYQINLALLPHQLWDDLKDDYPEKLQEQTKKKHLDFFADTIKRADAIGIKRYRDFMHFSLLCLTVHTQFDQDPEIKDQLSRFQSGEIDFVETMKNIDNSTWNRIGGNKDNEDL